MNHLMKRFMSLFGIFFVCFFVSLWALQNAERVVIIGSKLDPESHILAEILACRIQADTGFATRHISDLEGTWVCFNALTSKSIDMYVEYSGTASMAIFKAKTQLTQKELQERFKAEYDLAWLEPLGFENGYGLFVPKTSPLTKISQMSVESLAVDPELYSRQEFALLRQVYALPAAELVDQNLLFYTGHDVISASVMDYRVTKHQLRALLDDRDVLPSYEPAPLVRGAFLRSHPEIERSLLSLKNMIQPEDMQQLIEQVDQNQKSAYDCAMSFLQSRGLL